MAKHSNERPGSIHVVHQFEYADATARNNATGLTSDDIGRVAIQLDNNSFWLLVDDSPVTWAPFSATVNDHGALTGLLDDDHTQYQLRSEKSAAGGYASLDNSTRLPIGQLPANSIDSLVIGAKVSTSSVTELSIGATGQQSTLIDSTLGNIIEFSGVLTANISISGAGGLDVGSESADTWYATFVIGDSNNVNPTDTLLSLSAISPTLPGGYDLFRRVGWVRNNSSSDFVLFYQIGNGLNRQVMYLDLISNRNVISGGSAIGFATLDASAFIPPTSTMAHLHTRENGTTPVLLAQTSTALFGVLAGNEIINNMPITSSQTFAYGHLAAGGSTDIWVIGYSEEL